MEILNLKSMADARQFVFVDADFATVSTPPVLIKAVPVMIELSLFKMDKTAYQNTDLNCFVWGFVAANDYNQGTTPMLRSNVISVDGNTLKIDLSNMNTTELVEVLSTEKSVKLYAELTGKKDGVDTWIIPFNLVVKNRLDTDGIPTNVERDYYIKTEVDTIVDNVAVGSIDLSSYYTKTQVYNKVEVDNKISSLNISVDLSNYYNKSQVYSKSEAYNKTEIDTKFSSFTVSVDLTNYYTKGQVDTLISQVSGVDFSNYYTKTQVDTIISGLNITVDLSNYYTKSQVYNKTEVDTKFSNFSVDLSGYYTKSQTYSKTEVNTAIETAIGLSLDTIFSGVNNV